MQSSPDKVPQLKSSPATSNLLTSEAVPFLIDDYKGGTQKVAIFSD